MYLLKMASKWLSRTSPLGLVLAGTAVVAAAPMAKNILRGAAVTATRGILAVAEGGAAVASDIKEGWEDVVAEAKTQNVAAATSGMDTGTVVGAGAGGAIGASIGGGMAGATGAMVGGGLGSVVGAGVGSGVTEHKSTGHSAVEHTEHNKHDSKKPKKD